MNLARQLLPRQRVVIAALALGTPLTFIVGTTACARDGCPDEGARSCATMSSYTECLQNEDGSLSLYTYECSAGQTCDPKSGRCTAKALGEACAADINCGAGLRCESNVCVGATEEEVQRCLAAPVLVDVPAPGMSVDVAIPVDDTLTPTVRLMMRPYCDGQTSRFGRAGLIRLRPQRNGVLKVHYKDDESHLALVGEVDCSVFLGGSNAFSDQCGPLPLGDGRASVGPPEVVWLVALTADAPEATARFQLTAQELQ